jgi:hypothetical protein
MAGIQINQQALDPGRLLFTLLQMLAHPIGHLRIILKPSDLTFKQLDCLILHCMPNYAFEHYEIASYQSLLIVAEVAGQQASTSVLQQSLGEEQAMAQWIKDHLKPTMLRYVERYAIGETAGR